MPFQKATACKRLKSHDWTSLSLATPNKTEELATLVLVVCTHPCANLWPAETANHILIIEEKATMSLQLTTSKINQQLYSEVLCLWIEYWVIQSDARQWTWWLSTSITLYCIVSERSWGRHLGWLSIFSLIIRMWLAASAGHRLAQGWVHTTSTKVAGSSALLGVASDHPKIQRIYRS